MRVTTSAAIYVSRIDFRNTSYLLSISNDPTQPGAGLVVREAGACRVIISKDPVGIRDISFAKLRVLVGESVGLVLRRIRHEEPSLPLLEWDIPEPPGLNTENFLSCNPTVPERRRLVYVACDKDLTGLTVCCRSGKAVGIYAHCRGAPSYLAFMGSIESRFESQYIAWFFFPFNGGEQIEQIWIKRFKNVGGEASCPTIIISIRTIDSRIGTFGYANPYDEEYYDSRCLATNTNGKISAIYHNAVEKKTDSVLEIGVSCTWSSQTSQPLMSLTTPDFVSRTSRLPPEICRTMDWYMSKAPIAGLSGIQFCKDENNGLDAPVGLWLHYTNGTQEVLGRFRWDWRISDLDTNFKQVRFRNQLLRGRHFVRWTISEDEGDGETGLGWQSFPSHGVMLWWFGRSGDYLEVSGS